MDYENWIFAQLEPEAIIITGIRKRTTRTWAEVGKCLAETKLKPILSEIESDRIQDEYLLTKGIK